MAILSLRRTRILLGVGGALVVAAAFYLLQPKAREERTPLPLGLPSTFPQAASVVSTEELARLLAAAERYRSGQHDQPELTAEPSADGRLARLVFGTGSERCRRLILTFDGRQKPGFVSCETSGHLGAMFEIPLEPRSDLTGRWYYRDFAVEYDSSRRPVARYLAIGNGHYQKRTMSGEVLGTGIFADGEFRPIGD